MQPARSYPISMVRLRRGAGCLVLALMLLGFALSAGSAFATGGCCAMAAEQGSSEREGPCHSVAPTSCCEANAAGQLPGLPGAPLFAPAAAPSVLSGHPLPGAHGTPPPAPAARIALATIVLRL
jgi:hypothetical protein